MSHFFGHRSRRAPRVSALAFGGFVGGLLALTAGTGCSKIKSLVGGSDADGGSSASSGSGALSGALTFLTGGAPFEGEITLNMSAVNPKAGAAQGKTNAPQTVVLGLQGSKFRVDPQGDLGAAGKSMLAPQGGAFIVDPPAKKAFVLMPEQKKAMVVDFETLKAVAGNDGANPAGAPPGDLPKIDKTGKKDVVAGYGCDVWNVSSKGSRAELCVAEGIKLLDLNELGLSSPQVALFAAAMDANHLPLRVVAYDEKNVEIARIVATKIEKKKLDASRFVVPPEFQVMDMGAMLGGLPGGAGALGGAAGRTPPVMTPPKRPPPR